MLFSHRWLKEFLDFKLSPQKLANDLSMLGLEVASIEDLSKKYEKFIVGEVLEKTRHPNADRLSLCKVTVGKQVLDIVCGAPNVAAGQKVAVALIGATIPHNQHDPEGKPFVLESTRIRGVESHGMICSSYELGLGTDADGILVLDGKAKVGIPFSKYLGRTDVVYEIEITPNRGDWMSHCGVAREIAALLDKQIRFPTITLRESKISASQQARVKILDAEKCRRYCARVLRGVKVHASPKWLQDRLSAVGMRPINNVVDVTNYVMLETGQPLHAFDYDKIAGQAILVKCAAEGERFVTLDGKERILRSDTLMICDAEKPVGIGGVMGGANSEIQDSTTSILLESANFDPTNIRRTSRYLGVSTDASQRFERSADIEMTVYAIKRAAQLLQEISGAEVLKGVIDVYPGKFTRRDIVLRVSRTNAVLGTTLSKTTVKSYLNRLELICRDITKDSVRVTIPSHRNDLVEEIDLIEEVARIHGYNNIQTKMRGNIQFSEERIERNLETELREYLAASGFQEIVTNSMQEKTLASLASPTFVEVLNPVSKDMAALRTSLVPGVLQVIVHNINRGVKDLRLFEIGKTYLSGQTLGRAGIENYKEHETLLLAITGRTEPIRWDSAPRDVDIYDIKGEVETLLDKIFLDKVQFIYYSTTKALTDIAIGIEIHKTYAGYIGRVSEETRRIFDLKQPVYVAEIAIDPLRLGRKERVTYEVLPRFPAIVRDLAFIVEAGQSVKELIEVIQESGEGLISTIELFDVYVGENIGKGKKSMAFTIQFLSQERTLTDEEIERVIGHIVSEMQTRFQAALRST